MTWLTKMLTACALTGCLLTGVACGQQESTPAASRQYRDAVALQNQQLFDLAAGEWQAFLKHHADDPLAAEATHYLGICYFQQQRYADSVTAFARALQRAPQSKLSPATRLNMGLAHYNLGLAGKSKSFRAAVDTLTQLRKRHPRSAEAATAGFYLAESLMELSEVNKAVSTYEQALSQGRGGDHREQLLYGLGVALQEKGAHQQAQRRFAQLVREFPSGQLAREAQVRSADVLIALGKPNEAARLLDGLSTNPGDELADHILSQRAACLFELEKYTVAANVYATLVREFPKSELAAAATVAAGKSHYAAGKFAEARQYLARAVQATDAAARSEALHWLALTELKSGDPQAAVRLLQNELREADRRSNEQLQLDLADALYEIPNQRQRAVELYTSIAASSDKPLAAYALYMSAFGQLDRQQHAAAIQQSESFLRRYPDHKLLPEVMAILAEAEYQQEDFATAGNLWQQLSAKYPRRAEHDAWVVRRALCFERTEAPRQVIDWLRPRVRKLAGPALVEAACLVGNAYLALDEPDKALRVLEPLSQQVDGPFADQALALLAHAQQAVGRDKQAQATYTRLVKSYPTSHLAHDAQLQLAELAYDSGQFDQATAAYRSIMQASDAPATKAAALLGLAWSQLKLGDASESGETFAQLIKALPDQNEARQARYGFAVCLQQQEKYQAALEQLDVFLAQQLTPTERADALFVRGVCQAACKQYQPAIDSLRQVAKADPDYADRDQVLYELAWAYQSSGQEQAAARTFQQLSRQHPDSALAAEAHYRVAEAAYLAEDYDAARQSYHVALASATDRSEIAARAQHKIAWTLYQQDKFADAAKAFHRQLKNATAGNLSAVAQWMLGECAYRQHDHATALRKLSKAAAQPGGDTALRSLGMVHAGQSAAQLGQWQQSLEFHDRCLEDFPESPQRHQAQYGKAWALQNLDQPAKAQELYRRVADATPAVVGARARFMLGELQFAEQDYDAAIRSFFKVAYGYGHPDSPPEYHRWQADALFEAARCCESTKRVEAARRLYKQLLEQHPDSDKAPHAQRKIAALSP